VAWARETRGGCSAPTPAVRGGRRGADRNGVKTDNAVGPVDIKVYGMGAGETVLEDGVADGEVVVTDGQLRLTPGAAVEVKGAPDAAKGAGAGPGAAKAGETPGKEGSK